MTSARAYVELARLEREGWFVAVVPALGGQVGVLAVFGDVEVHRQGPTVASIAGELVAECRRWRLFTVAAA